MTSYLPEKQIIVVGYPRSGNTWLSRLLGDALNSPVTGWKNAKPLSEEGLDRTGEYTIRQLHLRPMYDNDCKEFMPSAYRANIPAWNGEKIIHIMRDPRDVAVSVYHYWDRPSIDDAVRVMLDGDHPLRTHGRWLSFVSEWMAVTDVPVFSWKYSDLVSNPYLSLVMLSIFIEADISEDAIIKAVDNQSFDAKKAHIAAHGEQYNYGETIQLKAMRKGIVGDWQNHFSVELAEKAWSYWGEFIDEYL